MYEGLGIRSSLLFFFLGCFISIFSLSFLVSSPAVAVDELYLGGILQSVDVISGTVVINVKSQSCPGPRIFKVDNARDLGGLKGRRISFVLDSSVCKGNAIYKIKTIAGMGGK